MKPKHRKTHKPKRFSVVVFEGRPRILDARSGDLIAWTDELRIANVIARMLNHYATCPTVARTFAGEYRTILDEL